METILCLVGAAAVAAVGVWARARFGGLRGTLLAGAVAAVVIAALVVAFGEGLDGWVVLLVIPVVFVAQTVRPRVVATSCTPRRTPSPRSTNAGGRSLTGTSSTPSWPRSTTC